MKRLSVTALLLAIAVTACAEGTVATDDPTSTVAPSSTTTPDVTSTTGSDTAAASDSTSTTAADSEASPSNDAFDDLVERVTNAPELTSGRIEVTVSVTGIDDPGVGVAEASFGIVTTFDAATDSSSVIMDLSGLAAAMATEPDDPAGALADAFAGEMEVRQIGDVAYVRMPLFNELLGVDTPWLSMSGEAGGEFTSGFSTVPTDPKDVMGAYDGASVVVEDLGSERVNGTDADHYGLGFDTSAWLDELSGDERAELEASGLLADGVLAMDVWVAEDGQLVRLVLTIDGATLDTPPNEGFDSMTMRYDLVEVGEAVVIEPPPAADVTPIDDLGFGDFDFDFATDA